MTGTSRERVRTALAHREPDRVPFDLGGSRMTGAQVRDLRAGGGFVLATVHNVQPNVPAANLLAMWEAWREEAAYG